MAAQKLNVRRSSSCPAPLRRSKVDAVRNRGARVVLHGDSFDEASVYARKLVEEKAMTYVHPFDDPDVIAGQGTIAMEIVRQHQQPLDAVFVPVGAAACSRGWPPMSAMYGPIRIVGVEPEDAACLQLALQKGGGQCCPGGPVRGRLLRWLDRQETFRVIRHTVDEVITISTDENVCGDQGYLRRYAQYCRTGGGTRLAGLKKNTSNAPGSRPAVACHRQRRQYIACDAERTETGEHRGCHQRHTAEQPGAFRTFCSALGRRKHHRVQLSLRRRRISPGVCRLVGGAGRRRPGPTARGAQPAGLTPPRT